MTVNINYGNKVAVIPAAAIEHLEDASSRDVKVLIAMSSESGKESLDLKSIADKLGIDLGELVVSLNFWQKNGIVSMSESLHINTPDIPEVKEEKSRKARPHHLARHHRSPFYICRNNGYSPKQRRLRYESRRWS